MLECCNVYRGVSACLSAALSVRGVGGGGGAGECIQESSHMCKGVLLRL